MRVRRRLFVSGAPAAAVAVALLFASALTFALAQEKPAASAPQPPPREVGGWEMTTYYVGFLYRGPKWTPETTPETTRIQEGHMANIRRMGETGKLLVAGPISDDGALRGMYVFKVDSMEEAEKLVRSDPAVQAGRLRFELHPWFAAKNIVVTPHAAPRP